MGRLWWVRVPLSLYFLYIMVRHLSASGDYRSLFDGINLGEVFDENGDIVGDAVNVAARIQTLCEPGQVYVSESAYQQLHRRIHASFEDLGRHSLKNIAEPQRVYRLEAESARGAAWLAQRVRVPLVPVAISGSEEAMGRGTSRISRQPIHATVCEPILPERFMGEADPVGAMTAPWWLQVDEALGHRYRP